MTTTLGRAGCAFADVSTLPALSGASRASSTAAAAMGRKGMRAIRRVVFRTIPSKCAAAARMVAWSYLSYLIADGK
ncbi:hypothetical protein GCM10011487_26030 [Steroidobacter agaridevorans]|uniref:Uncharacterized protein n=1 Tax=Steroidobacter agaridevorans TaxID=2695856 RepID=A0A829YCD1_9GAMM|nr:hypothetical protein GCM10011487_26030 [Steroidobacter agaridevorans]